MPDKLIGTRIHTPATAIVICDLCGNEIEPDCAAPFILPTRGMVYLIRVKPCPCKKLNTTDYDGG